MFSSYFQDKTMVVLTCTLQKFDIVFNVYFFFQNRPGRYSVPTTPTPMDKQNYGVMRRAMPAHVVAAQGTIHILRKQIFRVFGPPSPYVMGLSQPTLTSFCLF